MSVSLSKGGNVSLSKAAPSMKNVWWALAGMRVQQTVRTLTGCFSIPAGLKRQSARRFRFHLL